MRIWSLNSKRCSTAERLRSLTAAAAVLAMLATGPARASNPAPSARELGRQLSRAGSLSNFQPLLKKWESYGPGAAPSLLELASGQGAGRGLGESRRYVALMGAARLGGPKVAPRIAPLLRDSSWMLRSGALRALAALGDASTGPQVLPLLKDPSLAVRLEAVAATRRLRPPGAAQALLGVLGSGDNYHGGKALWVPGRALAALTALHATEAASSLRPLLDHMGDPDLLLETIDALERLTGRRLKPGAPLSVRVREWKLALSR